MDAQTSGLYEDLVPRHEWIKKIRRVRFGRKSKTREIALVLASYGNGNGTRNFPGIPKLADVCECDERTVRDALDKLRDLGLLRRVESGSKSGRPRAGEGPRRDHHILTAPADLEQRVRMLPLDEVDRERELRRAEARLADTARRRAKRQEAAVALANSSGNPAVNPEYQGKAEPPYQGKDETVTGETKPRNRGTMAPDKPALASDNSADPLIRPEIYRPVNEADHPAPDGAARTRRLARARIPSFEAFYNINWNERVQPGEHLTEDDEDYVYNEIAYAYCMHVLGDLGAVEESRVNGMLAEGRHPKSIVNKVLSERGAA